MFADPNKEATVQQKLSSLWQGISSVDELIQQFKIHGPKSRLGDIGLVHHFEQALNSCLRESIYQLHPMPRTWAEWKHEASILNNQWRWFNATHRQWWWWRTLLQPHHALLLCPAPLHPVHPLPAPPIGSSKLAAELQPMDLDCMKSKNPSWICYCWNIQQSLTVHELLWT